VVETSSLKKDLYRRDFTINTLAVKLSSQDFGQLIDFFGGQRDIKEGTIRVLHNLSFTEDPTRALRAVRFAERFGFSISRHTEKLIKTAVKMNLFDKLSGTRLYDELALLWKETEPVKAIERLQRYDLLKAIHPSLSAKELSPRFDAIKETLTWFELLYLEERTMPEVLYFAAMTEAVPEGQRDAFLKKLKVPVQAERLIWQCLSAKKVLAFHIQEDDPVSTYHALKGLPTEAVLYLMASTREPSVRKAISKYLLQLRDIRPSLTGKDLKEMGFSPGPIFSKILGHLLEEKLKGNLKTKEEERRFVLKYYGRQRKN
jgi:tRNA nucleotidyltransferase (CCA-adding enzyme)